MIARIVVYIETTTEHRRLVVNSERRDVPAEAAERAAAEIAAEAVKETMRRVEKWRDDGGDAA